MKYQMGLGTQLASNACRGFGHILGSGEKASILEVGSPMMGAELGWQMHRVLASDTQGASWRRGQLSCGFSSAG
jgi:hypothetical protein